MQLTGEYHADINMLLDVLEVTEQDYLTQLQASKRDAVIEAVRAVSANTPTGEQYCWSKDLLEWADNIDPWEGMVQYDN